LSTTTPDQGYQAASESATTTSRHRSAADREEQLQRRRHSRCISAPPLARHWTRRLRRMAAVRALHKRAERARLAALLLLSICLALVQQAHGWLARPLLHAVPRQTVSAASLAPSSLSRHDGRRRSRRYHQAALKSMADPSAFHTDDEWHPHDPASTTPQLLAGIWHQIAQCATMAKGVSSNPGACVCVYVLCASILGHFSLFAHLHWQASLHSQHLSHNAPSSHLSTLYRSFLHTLSLTCLLARTGNNDCHLSQYAARLYTTLSQSNHGSP
jgi:hypothetical protein